MTVDNSSTTVDTHLANSGFNLFGQPLSPSSSHPASPNHLMDYRNPVSPQLSPRSSPGPCHSLHKSQAGNISNQPLCQYSYCVPDMGTWLQSRSHWNVTKPKP
ncbi:hypothetical protein Hamer_G007356, partial [Homarus americanus]